MIEMLGLVFYLEGIYFCCFRQPTTTSLILSFPVPPFTTIRGFLENAIGYEKDSFALQEKDLLIGIRPLSEIEKTTELTKLLKLKENEPCFKRTFPSSPMFKTFLVNPKYKVYLVGDNKLIKEIAEKLKDPSRPLYLGQSDDFVDVKNIETMEVEKTKSLKIYSVIEGFHENCEIVKLPYKFINNGKDVEMKIISIPKKFPLKLKEEVECFKFGEEYVWCV